MGYKRLITMDVTEILRRKRDGQSISEISETLGYDRKTIRKYLTTFGMLGNSDNLPDAASIQLSINVSPGRPTEKQDVLFAYKQEIEELVINKQNPLKPKSAFEVICQRHNLSGHVSYSSFKRFVRKHHLGKLHREVTCRFEHEAASQIQIDYAKCGLVYDPIAQRKRTVYAFIATLSFSRHKFVEFVFKQDQTSFIQSNINMFKFFGGAARTIKSDNLKDAVIQPDLYDPKLNRSYAEMAEYYQVFIDPARIASPKDKGIVERDVQTIREEFRKMLAIDQQLTLKEANSKIQDWLINIYGKRKHGTTQQCPYLLFKEIEQPALMPLPEMSFEIAEWFYPTVGPDHYIQIKTKSAGEVKAYSLPTDYIGKKVLVKAVRNLVQIYYGTELIKQHTVALGFRQTDISDFPDNMRHSMDTGRPFYLRSQAAAISLILEELVTRVLSPNVYTNDRKARAIIEYAKNYPIHIVESASRYVLDHFTYISSKDFKTLLEKYHISEAKEPVLPLSEETGSFIRSSDYFTHQ